MAIYLLVGFFRYLEAMENFFPPGKINCQTVGNSGKLVSRFTDQLPPDLVKRHSKMSILSEVPPDWQNAIGGRVADKDLDTIQTNPDRTQKTCPPRDRIFHAFHPCPFDAVKIVIVGQDPYTHGEATGLAFAVKRDKKISLSLRNIFRRVEAATGSRPPEH